jgi:hypothetical protein
MNQTKWKNEMSKKSNLILIENRGTSRKPVWVLTMKE